MELVIEAISDLKSACTVCQPHTVRALAEILKLIWNQISQPRAISDF